MGIEREGVVVVVVVVVVEKGRGGLRREGWGTVAWGF